MRPAPPSRAGQPARRPSRMRASMRGERFWGPGAAGHTPTAPARRSWAGRCTTSPTATRWSSPPSSVIPCGWAPTPSTSIRSDLYQIHRNDHSTPVEEPLEALSDLVTAGKVRYPGASSMPAWEFAKALHLQKHHGWARFVSMQHHYNLLAREEEREMIPLALDGGVGTVIWRPVARGRLGPAVGPEVLRPVAVRRRVRRHALLGGPGRRQPGNRRRGRAGGRCPWREPAELEAVRRRMPGMALA